MAGPGWAAPGFGCPFPARVLVPLECQPRCSASIADSVVESVPSRRNPGPTDFKKITYFPFFHLPEHGERRRLAPSLAAFYSFIALPRLGSRCCLPTGCGVRS